MRVLLLISLFLCAVVTRAEECGLYQYEDFGDRRSYILVQYSKGGGQPALLFHIVNPVGSMVNGLCYCVEGEVSNDPSYPGDDFNKSILVRRVTSGPDQYCQPLQRKDLAR